MNSIMHLYNGTYSCFRFENSHPFDSPSGGSENGYEDDDQVPSMEEFQSIINDYLTNLSPKKRDKALVDQSKYMLIRQVLRDPRNTTISTAQFRFWVKKMFKLEKDSTEIVCHDDKPVATKEQIYTILVSAHRDAKHGGRDKTAALVRRRFSWIPKELVARFVRHCPSCITRRSTILPSTTPTVLSKSPRGKSSRLGSSFDSTPFMRTPSSSKEESDVSESGYDTAIHYPPFSSSSPKKAYVTKEDPTPDFMSYTFFTDNNRPPSHPHPQSPLYYHTGYSLYNTSCYYPSALGITTSSSPGAAVAVAAAASSTAAAMATDLLSHQGHYRAVSQSRTNHFTSYQQLNMPENGFNNGI